jgi:predicted permease
MLQRLAARIRALWNWRRNESALDEEIQFHLSEEADEREAAGVSAETARLAAHRDFGNVTLIREKTRDTWGWGGAERLLQDARHGLRALRHQPGFSAVAVLTLALGIGATTAVMSVVNALLIRPLPFDDATELVQVYATALERNVYRDTTSFLDFSEWKGAGDAIENAAAFSGGRPMTLTGDGPPELVYGLHASYELFDVLRVMPVLGRPFTAQEQHDKAAVALISHELWSSRYGSDPQILNKTILVTEIAHAVIGVMPAGFEFPAYTAANVIVPILERPCRSCGYLRVIARLRPGARVATAQAQLDVVAAGLEQAYPESNEGRGVRVVPLADVAVGAVRSPLLLLLGASSLVLLIGCGNVGNLILARGLARERELAVRSALGAGAGRLVRQLLTESTSLALVAALLGAVFGYFGRRVLIVAFTTQFPMPPIGFDWSMLALTMAIAIIAGVLSGVPLALMVWRASPSDSLKHDSRSQSGGPRERRLGHLLIIGETALTVMLLASAALLTIDFTRWEGIDLGFDPRRALSADLMLSKRNADPARRALFTQHVVDALRALPGVEAVATHVDPPFRGGRRETFSIEGRDDPGSDSGHPAGFDIVSDRFFEAVGIPIVQGRAFDARDTSGSAAVAVVNETMARAFWPQENPIGKRLRFYYERDRPRWLSVIGVAKEVRYRGRAEEPMPQVFISNVQPFYKAQDPMVSLIVRTRTDPEALLPAVRAQIWSVEKDQVILRLQSLDTVLWQRSAGSRAYALLVSIFAAIALVIAGAGVYGSNAYAVTRRTQEIGIRLAMGATSRQILRLVVGQGMIVVAIGLALGLAGSLALARITSRFVAFVTATDPGILAGVVLLFALVALVSTLVPARRAMKTDPAVAFRHT